MLLLYFSPTTSISRATRNTHHVHVYITVYDVCVCTVVGAFSSVLFHLSFFLFLFRSLSQTHTLCCRRRANFNWFNCVFWAWWNVYSTIGKACNINSVVIIRFLTFFVIVLVESRFWVWWVEEEKRPCNRKRACNTHTPFVIVDWVVDWLLAFSYTVC